MYVYRSNPKLTASLSHVICKNFFLIVYEKASLSLIFKRLINLFLGLLQHVKEHHRNRLSDFDDAKLDKKKPMEEDCSIGVK